MGQIIKRGILQSFNSNTYTASVLLLEATSTFLTGIPVSNTMDGTSMLSGTLCAVLFFDEHNAQDAVVIAIFPNSTQGVPTPAPGRITFVPSFLQINGLSIASGAVQVFTVTGGSSGIPSGALGIIYRAYFTSPSVGAYLHMAPHGAANRAGYAGIGNMPIANGYLNTTGVLQVDSNGQIDIYAGSGICTVTMYTHGYII